MKHLLPILNTNTQLSKSFSLFLLVLFPFALTAQDQPPVVTATGNQLYCPGSPMPIVTAFNITDPDDTGTDAIYIQISEGYVNGQDFLTLTPAIPNVTTTWNPTSAKLIIRGISGQELPYTTLINAVMNVRYNSTAANPTGSRTFSITVGEANYLPSTGHYYRFISQPGITWTSARTAAQASNYYGLQGYLATLLSAEEAQLCGEQATGTGWIGGSDSQVEGVWRWMTGPEAGTIFWNGAANGSTPNFAFWNNGEPNNSGEEDYAHITAPGVGVPGSWNDLPNAGSGGDYAPMGYIAEYGGMPGDPVLQISASTMINMGRITSSTPATRCGDGTVTLTAVADFGTPYWYTAATGGTEIAGGTSFTTPILTTTTTYYVSAYDSSCTTAQRTAVIATVNPLPTITTATPIVNICQGTTATLEATPSSGSVRWYTVATGGTPISSGTTFTTPAITANTTYYAEAFSPEGCPSAARVAIAITTAPQPSVTILTPPTLCDEGIVTLQATPSAGIVTWYTSDTGGTAIATGNTYTTPLLTQTTTYYAEVADNGCASAARQAVTVTVNEVPVINLILPVSVCNGQSATLTVNTASGAMIKWYDAPSGGTLLYTGPSFTTPVLNTDTTYYAEAIGYIGGCISDGRTAAEVIVLQFPTVTVTATAHACGQGTATLEGTPSDGTIEWYDAPTGGNLIGTGNSIQSPAITADTVFYAEAVNNGCPSVTREAVSVIHHELPAVAPDEDVVFCENGDTDLDADITGVTYLWSTGQTMQIINIDEPGIYTVEVTSPEGCSAIRTFTATTIDAPEIDKVLVSSGTVTIIMENNDPENYRFSIDGGPYQDSNQFTNLPSGYHTASALSRSGCGEDFYNFQVRLVPRFFTPNGDSINDVFTLAGFYAFPNATVDIFDRYGKLITQLSSRNREWDGTHNGTPLPATDYWYIIKIDAATPEIRGHFSLIR
jgi:gliding motility-associated-like protein